MRPDFDLSLYLVLDPVLCQPLGMVETARRAVAGGAGIVQLRDKQAVTREMIATARALKAALAGTGALLIVNDDVEAAIASRADGVHVGQGDLNPAAVRARIGPARILGLSVTTLAEARAADPACVDYLGIGPVFPTGTKADHAPAMGIDGLQAAVGATSLPAVAIGGLKAAHVGPVLATGAQGLAVVSAICGQADPEGAARDLMHEIRSVKA